MKFQEHHFRNLGRARDALTETILSLQSAAERMTGDDWIDAKVLLADITSDIGPRLSRLRTAASERFDEHTRLGHFEQMRTGRLPFPDERLPLAEALPERPPIAVDVPRLEAPNAKRGANVPSIGFVKTRADSASHSGQDAVAGAVPIGATRSKAPSRSQRYS
jgi:hypothetical protein